MLQPPLSNRVFVSNVDVATLNAVAPNPDQADSLVSSDFLYGLEVVVIILLILQYVFFGVNIYIDFIWDPDSVVTKHAYGRLLRRYIRAAARFLDKAARLTFYYVHRAATLPRRALAAALGSGAHARVAASPYSPGAPPGLPAASSGPGLLNLSKRKINLTAHVAVARQAFDAPTTCQCPFHAGSGGGVGGDAAPRRVPVLYAPDPQSIHARGGEVVGDESRAKFSSQIDAIRDGHAWYPNVVSWLWYMCPDHELMIAEGKEELEAFLHTHHVITSLNPLLGVEVDHDYERHLQSKDLGSYALVDTASGREVCVDEGRCEYLRVLEIPTEKLKTLDGERVGEDEDVDRYPAWQVRCASTAAAAGGNGGGAVGMPGLLVPMEASMVMTVSAMYHTFDDKYGDGNWGELGLDHGRAADLVHDPDGRRSSSGEVRSDPRVIKAARKEIRAGATERRRRNVRRSVEAFVSAVPSSSSANPPANASPPAGGAPAVGGGGGGDAGREFGAFSLPSKLSGVGVLGRSIANMLSDSGLFLARQHRIHAKATSAQEGLLEARRVVVNALPSPCMSRGRVTDFPFHLD